MSHSIYTSVVELPCLSIGIKFGLPHNETMVQKVVCILPTIVHCVPELHTVYQVFTQANLWLMVNQYLLKEL